MIKRLLTTIAVALSTAAPAIGSEAMVEQHRQLWRDINSVGVTIVINPFDCNEGYDGSYESQARVITVCQDEMDKYGVMVGWTDNDFDTLRHEAHHLIQDCADGRMADGYLRPFFDEDDMHEFVNDALSRERINWIGQSYGHNGEESVILELEAFAVAKVIEAETIGDKVIELCTR